jgi:hypothetical protein
MFKQGKQLMSTIKSYITIVVSENSKNFITENYQK